MADQGKWFKLWCSSIEDADLENLELEDWARWAKLGAYIKAHGVDGKIRFPPPYRKLLSIFRVTTLEHAISILKLFPHVQLGEREVTVTPVTNATVSLEIEYQNWFKYQGDFSRDRVRKFRDKKRHDVTAQEERRRDVEEKRRETPIARPSPRTSYPLPSPEKEPKKCLVLSYKVRKGVPFDNRDWDQANFPRSMKASNVLLGICGDLAVAQACLDALASDYDSKDLSWTLETVARNASEWLKKVGKLDANASRSGLRMAIAQSDAARRGQNALAQISPGEISATLGNGPDARDRDKKDSG